ncbi:metallophosphoesterase [Aliiroseovarius sp. F20344]|uniref:metallophosphoesterase n=1 Tax=Aliiroseovarius sp. F20344 TaxID=2926414 RepID=UPI001FF661AF|nr:metallophosphoesterase [Aliiroseovarius sp. F20344]MCK0143115.1 metallophosphoesterase [Aliiroseovarius sp. F20344]
MAKLLDTLFRKFGAASEFDAALAPDQPFLVVGDIHGRLDALQAALDLIARHPEYDQSPLVFVGDYMDRGPASAEVLRLIMALQSGAGREVICLRGNHEQLLLSFLENPVLNAPVWFSNGGLETLRSFGVNASKLDMRGDRVMMVRERLKKEMGEAALSFIEGLPTRWTTGNVAVVHAGADPAVSIENQEEDFLVWGHPDFRRLPRQDGIWVAHGHTIVPDVSVRHGRIAVDTGAYRTGILPVVSASSEGVKVLGREDFILA